MLLAKVIFGEKGTRTAEELEEIAMSYLADLWKGGQIGRDYSCAWVNGTLNASVRLAGNNAFALRYHTNWGKQSLAKVVDAFGKPPQWVLLDDAASKNPPRWKKASGLYLFTRAWNSDPVIYNSDTENPIPTYLFPLNEKTKQDIGFWSEEYANHDAIWFASGALEIPAYKQMADPRSQLSETGRALCKEIEVATGIPTYYYMVRYWGRRKGEENRKCPLCGGDWALPVSAKDKLIRFRCDKCRLVGSFADCPDNERYAHIGEYRQSK